MTQFTQKIEKLKYYLKESSCIFSYTEGFEFKDQIVILHGVIERESYHFSFKNCIPDFLISPTPLEKAILIEFGFLKPDNRLSILSERREKLIALNDENRYTQGDNPKMEQYFRILIEIKKQIANIQAERNLDPRIKKNNQNQKNAIYSLLKK